MPNDTHTPPVSSAADAAAGYYFQLDRALLHLAKSTAGAIIGVEGDDDVTHANTGKLIHEQDKLTRRSGVNPLSDRSVNLWNTLAIWVRHYQICHTKSKEIEYCLVTNARVPSCLARRIAEADCLKTASGAITEMRRVATSTRSKEILPLSQEVLAMAMPLLQELVIRIRVYDSASATHSAELDDQIVKHLRLPQNIDAKELLRSLKGWAHESLTQQWRNGAAYLTFEAFNEQKFRLISMQRRRQILERPEREVHVTEADRKAARLNAFLKHLLIISLDDPTVDDAVDAYVRFRTEYVRLLHGGEISPSDWEDFFQRLRRRWEGIFRRHCRHGTSSDREILGQSIHGETCEVNYKEPLAGESTQEPYLTTGAYHHLANGDTVYWHPDYIAS